MEKNILKLEIGKKYILRNGEITEPMQKEENGTNYKYFFVSKEGYFNYYLINGKRLSNNIETETDIIKEIQP